MQPYQNKNGLNLFCLFLLVSLCLFISCRKNSTPSAADTNYLYITIHQNVPSCPLTLTVTGPTTFQDIQGPAAVTDSLIAFNYGAGGYTFAFNGATDGVSHELSGPETISCNLTLPSSCSSWSYSVKP